MKKSELIKIIKEEIKINVSIGDTILTGKFKNKKTEVKEIGLDDHGMPTINGRKICTFRFYNSSVDEHKTSLSELLNNILDGDI